MKVVCLNGTLKNILYIYIMYASYSFLFTFSHSVSIIYIKLFHMIHKLYVIINYNIL